MCPFKIRLTFKVSFNPQKHTSGAVLPYVQFVKKIRGSVLQNSLFPDLMNDKNEQFSKPADW